MAQAPHPTGDGADFVRKIVADPKNVPDVMLLYGYLGASSEEGHERLYLSPDLGNFVEVPEKSILHRAQAAKEQDPNSGVTLWVKKDAKLNYKMAPAQQAAQQALAYYFAGAIQGGAGAAAAPMTPALTVVPQCVPPTLADPQCPVSQADPCPSRFPTCHPQACTNLAPCPTHVATCAATCHATCAPGVTCGVDCTLLCTRLPPCQTHVATCAVTCHATCAPACTHVAPCPTHVATCPPNATCAPGCPTHHVTCAPTCTQITPCVTRGQPDCPFPSEIPAQCSHLPNCPHPQAAAAPMGAVGCAAGTIVNTGAAVCRVSVVIVCTPACPTHYVSCYGTCNPQCWITRYATCYVTCNPEVCWITRACPVETAACPVSLGCPGPGPGPVPFMDPQTMALGHTCPCQMTPWCAQ